MFVIHQDSPSTYVALICEIPAYLLCLYYNIALMSIRIGNIGNSCRLLPIYNNRIQSLVREALQFCPVKSLTEKRGTYAMFLRTFSDVSVVPCSFKYSLVRDIVCTSCIELYSTFNIGGDRIFHGN